MKNMHGIEIVCDADRSDWGRKWGYGKEGDGLCWCYECTMKRLDEQRAKEKLEEHKK